jgi:hypothetical protein
MTTLLETAADTAGPAAPSRRRRWLLALIGVVVLSLVGTGIGVLVYVNTYQPLGEANVGVVGTSTPRTLKLLTDGLNDTGYALVGPKGSTGVTHYTFANNGSHAVRMLGLDPGRVAFLQVRWSPPSSAIPPPASAARAFPFTLRPGEMVFLQVTVTQPACSSAALRPSGIPLRWSALGVHHVWTLPLGSPSDNLPITLCAPRSVLAHVDNGSS